MSLSPLPPSGVGSFARLPADAALDRLALAVRIARIGVLELDGHGALTWCDERVPPMLGVQVDRLPLPHERWSARIHAHDLDTLRDTISGVRQGRREDALEVGVQFRVTAADGTVQHLLCRLRRRDGGPDGGVLGVLFDVTALREAEREAHEAAARLRLTTEGAGVGFWRLSLGTNELELDVQARRLLGLPDGGGGATFADWADAIVPADRDEVRARLQRALQQGGAFDMEYRVRAADGGVRHLADRGVVQFDESGRPVSVNGILWDLTPRRMAEAAARAATERLQVASRSTGFGVWEWDVTTGAMVWDERFHALTGQVPPQRDRTIAHLRQLVHADDRARLDEALARALDGSAPLDLEVRVERGDGVLRWLAARGHVERDASHRAAQMLGVVWDVTDRRAAEERAREAAQRLHLATTTAGIGIWDRDIRTDEMVWDEGMYRLFGRVPGELSPRDCFNLGLHAEDRGRVHAARSAAATAGTVYQSEFRVVRPDGEIRWLAGRGVVQRGPDGTPLRMLGVTWDVTEARRAEQSERARETAERSNRAKSEFLSRMSHELRTPLNAILGFAQLLELDTAEPLTPGQRDRVGRIHAAGWHLMRLIGDVLDLSRIEAGAAALSMEIVSLEPLLAEAVSMMQPELDLRGLRLVQSVPADAPRHAWADGTRLKQVLLNVLSNACRYNRPRGTVSIAIRPGLDERVVIAVADTGRGLSRQQLAQLFQPFNRLGLESVEPDGTGIGLAISQRLVEQMRGTIEVSSELGGGSEFRIVLNAARVDPQPGDAPPMAAGRSRVPLQAREDVGGCVLYIEDNPANSALVEQLLHFRPGITLYKAQDGATGLVLASACRPDLVLVDMRLPDMDGLRLLRQLRQQPETLQVPCVALSANAMHDDIGRALASGFAEYWTKPLDAVQFLAGIDRYVGRHARQAAVEPDA